MAILAIASSWASTIYFENTKNWNPVYMWSWGGSDATNTEGSFPGRWNVLEKAETVQINGTTYYKIETQCPSVIFAQKDENGYKTGDLVVHNNVIYNGNGASSKAIINGEITDADFATYKLRGQILGVGSWADYDLTETEFGTWVIYSNEFEKGEFGFKRMLDGQQANWLFAPQNQNTINGVGTYSVIKEGDAAGANFNFQLEGAYTLTLDPSAGTLTVEKGRPLYLRGEMNDWGPDPEWKFTDNGDGVYTLKNVAVHADADFKIASSDFIVEWGGAGMVSFDKAVKLVNEEGCANCYLQDGSDDVTFEFDSNTGMLTVTNNAGEVHPHAFIYFENTGNWADVYCLLTDDEGNRNAAGDGIKLNNLVVGNNGKTYYRAHIDNFTKVSFNNGETGNNFVSTPGTYDVVENNIYNASGETGVNFLELPAYEGDRYYYYFARPDGWGDVYAYAWDDNGTILGAWPGKKLTQLVDNIYVVGSSVELGKLIFNNGSNAKQTVDIDDAQDGYLYTPAASPVNNKYPVTSEEYNAGGEIENLINMSVEAPLTLADNKISGTLPALTSTFNVNFDFGENIGLQIWWKLTDDAEWNIANVTTPYATIEVGEGSLIVMAVRGTIHSDEQTFAYDVTAEETPETLAYFFNNTDNWANVEVALKNGDETIQQGAATLVSDNLYIFTVAASQIDINTEVLFNNGSDETQISMPAADYEKCYSAAGSEASDVDLAESLNGFIQPSVSVTGLSIVEQDGTFEIKGKAPVNVTTFDVEFEIPAVNGVQVWYKLGSTSTQMNAPARAPEEDGWTALSADNNAVEMTVGNNAPLATKVSVGNLESNPVTYANAVQSGTTGVEDVVVEGVEDAEYYNLQGVRVANPANGVYIRVVGGQALKVAL